MIWYLDPSHEGEERAVRVLVRIMDKVRIGPGPDACWVWIGGRTPCATQADNVRDCIEKGRR